AAIVVAYVALALGAARRAEEAHLTAKFGAVYERYRAGVVDARAGARRFSFARARANGEPRTLAGVVLVLGLLVWRAFG
ncbi:MAG TPA: hypothetical protein VNK92_03970, partial [Vicinamibacterales bacterium]|nr:hypothetical protein [Vicinamibacterales bacterium]